MSLYELEDEVGFVWPIITECPEIDREMRKRAIRARLEVADTKDAELLIRLLKSEGKTWS